MAQVLRLTDPAELEWRAECYFSVVEFSRWVPTPGVPQKWLTVDGIYRPHTQLAAHHILILETLQKMSEGKLISPTGKVIRNTFFFLPPGSSKSTYATVLFPLWFMARYPDSPIILASYGTDIAVRHGRRARQVAETDEFRRIFQTALDPTTQAANFWKLQNGSSYLANGLKAGLTGNRAAGLIIDDAVRGRQDAESYTEQQNTWSAYKDDARSRKVPGAWECQIQTRWHERDLAGQILPEGWRGESGFIDCKDGNTWYVICLPAIAEHADDPLGRQPGEPLWAEWFNEEGDPMEYWRPLQLDSRSWSSLYQQVPTPPEGEMFKASWVQRYDALPTEGVKYYLSADYAVTEEGQGDDPDWSVIILWAIDPERRIFYVDSWRHRTSADQWIEAALDFVRDYEPMAHIAGGGPVRRGTEPFFKRRMIDRGHFVRLVWQPETHGKEENARAFQAIVASGLVYWPRSDEKAEYIIRELTGFPTLTHDDAFDACSMLGRYLAKLWGGKVEKEEEALPVIEPAQINVAKLIKSWDKKRSNARW